MFSAVVGHSEETDAGAVARELLDTCKERDSAALILFASDTVDITAGVGRSLSKNVDGACHQAVEMANAKTRKPSRLCARSGVRGTQRTYRKACQELSL